MFLIIFQRKHLAAVLVALALLMVLLYSNETSRTYLTKHIPEWRPNGVSSATTERLPIPTEYDSPQQQSPFCVKRFSPNYLEYLRDHAVSYCSAISRSNMTCFHSNTGEESQNDSFCAARGAVPDRDAGKFRLDCEIRTIGSNETAKGLIEFDQMRGYWYNTGPAEIFRNHITGLSGNVGELVGESEKRAIQKSSPRFYLLLQREGAESPWHSLLEIT